MKLLSKITFILIMFLAALSLTSCKNDNGPQGPVVGDPYTSWQDLINQLGVSPKSFTINPAITNYLVGDKGTEISLPADAFLDANDDLVSGDVTVTLREFYSREDIVLSGISTNSFDNMLVSGGSFEMRAKQNGLELKLKPGANISARFPQQTEAEGFENEMLLFTSNDAPNAPNGFNWQQAGERFATMDTFFGTVGYFLNEIQLGWSNCDALYAIASTDRTQFQVNVPGFSQSNVKVFLLVKDLTSVINLFTQVGPNFATYANSVPVGLEATLVAVAVANDELHYGSTKITATGDDLFEVIATSGTTDGLKDLLGNPF